MSGRCSPSRTRGGANCWRAWSWSGHTSLPSWGGDLEAARQGLSEEPLAQSARLEEARCRACHAVWADEYWAKLSGEDRVAARNRLQHIDDPVVGAA
ncbi:hypothetical protein [Kitasatospora sp. NPDC093102]|uniref:hypothetical protein n=1 Tax=Kitasatospora sp. NPDC093102 TaxID=3155069 RepID=UPI0034474A8B